MAFLENASAAIIGGMAGGFIVLFAMGLWYKFRTFQLYYLDPKENLMAEHMQEYTALRTDVGLCSFHVRVRPRRGLILTAYNIAFFDKGCLPWLHGKRRSINDIKVYNMRYCDSRTRDFHDSNLQILDDDGSYTEQPTLSLASGSSTFFELDVEVGNILNSWEGILSFQFYYERDGNPDKKNVRTKFFVSSPNKRRPVRCIGKKVLRCEAKLAQLEIDRTGS